MLNLHSWAEAILLGKTLTQKLAPPPREPGEPGEPLALRPEFPGRPPQLAVLGRVPFPAINRLATPRVRGEVLHFFANHELLALEGMALALLLFPAAPAEFRTGLTRTMADEQRHLELYLERMAELGVEFGELPLSDHFWRILRAIQSPLDYVLTMSLTFEQANLDFSLHYRDALATTGDTKTAAILDRVYREEIAHVARGVTWFNRMRNEDPAHAPTDWEDYCRLLPASLTPRRGRGLGFAADARRQAGFSDRFVREMELGAGARGNPRVLWYANTLCDVEIAATSTRPSAQDRVSDLAHLPMFLARAQDAVLLPRPPTPDWLARLHRLGFAIPEFVTTTEPIDLSSLVGDSKIAGFEPWGWSPTTHALFRPLAPRLVPAARPDGPWCRDFLAQQDYAATGLAAIFSKAFAADFLRNWISKHAHVQPWFGSPDIAARICTSWDEIAAHLQAISYPLLLKAPWSTAGMGLRLLRTPLDLTPSVTGWAQRILEQQGSLLAEPYLARTCDLSIQLLPGATGARRCPVRRFLVGRQFQYRGTFLGSGLPGLPPEARRFLMEPRLDGLRVTDHWHQLLEDLASELEARGYPGRAGIDAFLHRTPSGELQLKPLVELNPRQTMGQVALALESHLAPATEAFWGFITPAVAAALEARFPLEVIDRPEGPRLASGVLLTSDPATSTTLLTALFIGPDALKETTTETEIAVVARKDR